ncbi:hypothetical protein ABXN37_05900 [Piscinibacter sakaiensis]|uniref:glutamine synthetase family protein n=1 Tax=Piscinibacter sakaiensis TaxID=1547922 RepID=UPI00372CA81F
MRSLARQGGFLQALRRALEAAGLTVLQIDHEDAPGQYELNLRHDEVLRSADHLMLVRLAGRALAEAHGAVFSCMPKPFADQPGSGLHVHASLWQDTGDGGPARNLFAGESSDPMHPQALSPLAQHFVAGLLAHSPALCALAAPTVNSYRRLAVRRTRSGTSWAPASISHGPNNRTAQVRTLADRIEWRLPDAAANPYLLSAGLIAAGLDGIDRALPLPPACRDDLFELDAPARAALGIGALPASLAEALDTFEASALLREALGPEAHREFLALGRAQWDEYAGHVSDWEWARWADA